MLQMEKTNRYKRIQMCYNILRALILIVFLGSLILWAATAEAAEKSEWMPEIHGTVRGKFEYEPALGATRFEVRNARLSAEGLLPFGTNDSVSSPVLKRGVRYKAEIDLSDEGTIKMLDAYVQVLPWRSLRLTLGQMRVPFSIDAHRSPHQQFFANRSFIAKQVGNVRDVGLTAGYTWYIRETRRPVVLIDAGLFNGSGLTAQKTAWHRDVNFSARLQCLPLEPWNITLSAQRNRVGADSLHYLSLAAGSCYHDAHWHAEAEYLLKRYSPNQFSPVHAVDVFLSYTHPVRAVALSYLARYDYMSRQELTDAERHRLTAGLTLHLFPEKRFRTDLRLNYEKYFYAPDAAPKQSEQDKLVAELMLRF